MAIVNPFNGEVYDSVEDMQETIRRRQEDIAHSREAIRLSELTLPISKRYENAMSKVEGLKSLADCLALKAEFDNIEKKIRTLPSGCEEYKADWLPQCEKFSDYCEIKARKVDPIAYTAMKAEEKRVEAENLKNSALARLSTAKSKINNNAWTSTDFAELSKNFDSIASMFRSLPSSFDVKAYIEECVNCRKQCEEKQAQCKNTETITQFNTAKAKLKNVQTADEYDKLAKDFADIERSFRSCPSTFEIMAQIEASGKYRKLCEDNHAQYKNAETISQFNTAKAKLKNIQMAGEYKMLAQEFADIEQAFQSLPNSFDVKAYIEECVNYRKESREKQQQLEEKQQRKAKAEVEKSKIKAKSKVVMLYCVMGILGSPLGMCIGIQKYVTGIIFGGIVTGIIGVIVGRSKIGGIIVGIIGGIIFPVIISFLNEIHPISLIGLMVIIGGIVGGIVGWIVGKELERY
jgi:uncharacterized protein YqcC (DUF446 family)